MLTEVAVSDVRYLCGLYARAIRMHQTTLKNMPSSIILTENSIVYSITTDRALLALYDAEKE